MARQHVSTTAPAARQYVKGCLLHQPLKPRPPGSALVMHLLTMQADEAEEQGIELGDQVSFSRVIYCRSGAVWARELQVVCKAARRRELGQVSPHCDVPLTWIAPSSWPWGSSGNVWMQRHQRAT